MRSSMMTSFVDQQDHYTQNCQNNGSVPMSMTSSFDPSFNSSFSSSSGSSAASWDMLSNAAFSTPPSSTTTPRRDSYGSLDMDNLSSCPTSHVGTPIDEFYPMNPMSAMTQNMLSGQDPSYFTPTPCNNNRSSMGQNLMTYDFQYAGNMYSPYGSQGYSPSMVFDNSSPIAMTSMTPSPSNHFVDPSQTFIEPFQPETPLTSQRILGSSPMDGYDSPSAPLQYFVTPTPSHSAQSSRSYSSEDRSPINAALESSAALHRIQSSGRIRKQQRKSQTFGGNNIVRVSAGEFRCTFPGCLSKHAFKRQEHLKRHKKTHEPQKDLQCAYCPKRFQADRADNYRSHIRLHGNEDKKGSRTKFFAEAKAVVDEWDKERSRGERLAPAAQIGGRLPLRSMRL